MFRAHVASLLLWCCLHASADISLTDPLFKDGAQVDYLIISASDPDIIGQANRLAEWKTAKGLKSRVVLVDSIVSAFDGVDDQQRIRNFLKLARADWGITWVLLLGDLSAIPARHVSSSGTDFDAAESDVYYSCLDGEWDAGYDGIYGNDESTTESGLVCTYDQEGNYTCRYVPSDSLEVKNDLWSDVYIGRLPASNGDEARIMVDKIIAYRDTPRAGEAANDMGFVGGRIFQTVYMPSDTGTMTMDDATYAWHYQIKPFFDSDTSPFKGVKYHELYEDRVLEDGTILDDSAYIGIDDMSNFISRGYNVLFFSFHGWPNGIWISTPPNLIEYHIEDVAAVKFASTTNIISISCCIMKMVPGTNTSFAKSFLINPTGGAVSYTGSAGVDYFTMRKYSYLRASQLLTSGGIRRIAQAGALANVTSFSRHNILVHQHWGDPELELWTRPTTAADSFAVETDVVDGALQVRVTPALDSVLVCAYKEGKVFARAYTVAGEATFDSVDLAENDVRITASMTNYLPGRTLFNPTPVGPTAVRGPFASAIARRLDVMASARGTVIRLANATPGAMVLLCDMMGKTMARSADRSGNLAWHVGTLARGMYVVRVKDAETVLTRRFAAN